MDAQGTNEDPIRQMGRLFQRTFGTGVNAYVGCRSSVKTADDRELRSDVVAEVARRWEEVNTENFLDLSDYAGFLRGFRNLFGFEVDGVGL